jgi:hypothetical protein
MATIMELLGIILTIIFGMELLAALIRSRMSVVEGVFKSDGCTFVPEANWGECCEEHDKAYVKGGWFLARLRADYELMKCIGRNKNWFAAVVYFLGVRAISMWRFRYGKKIDFNETFKD